MSPSDGTRVHFCQRIVQRLAIAQRLVDRRIEAIENAQLELVRALEEVLEVGEREHNVGDALRAAAGSDAFEPSIRAPPLHPLGSQHVVPELRPLLKKLVAGNRCPGQVQELLASRHRHVEQPPLVFDGTFEARLALDAGAGQ